MDNRKKLLLHIYIKNYKEKKSVSFKTRKANRFYMERCFLQDLLK